LACDWKNINNNSGQINCNDIDINSNISNDSELNFYDVRDNYMNSDELDIDMMITDGLMAQEN